MKTQAMPLVRQQAVDTSAGISPQFAAILAVYPDYLQHTSLADDQTMIASYNRFPLPDKFPAGKSWLDYPLGDRPFVERSLSDAAADIFTAAAGWIKSTSAPAPLLTTLIDSWPESLRVGDVVIIGKFRWMLDVLTYMKRVRVDSLDPVERAIWRRAAQRIYGEIRSYATSAIWFDQEDPRSPLNIETGLDVYTYIVAIGTTALDIFRAFYLKKLTESADEDASAPKP